MVLRELYFFRRPVLMALAVYCVGILIAKRAGFLDRVAENDPAVWAGERGAVTGVVAAHPDPRATGCAYRIEAETLDLFESRKNHALTGHMLIHVMKSTTPLASPGDRVRVVGRLQIPKTALTPGAFDYQDYLATHGVHAVMYTSARSFENLGFSGGRTLVRWGWRLKRKAVAAFDRYLNPEQSTVLAGLAVGNRPRFHPEVRRVFVESGTMHVLVASGSNVAFVIALWFLLARLARVPRRWALVSSLPAIWIYVLLAGADDPITRAGLMGTIGVLAYVLDREDRPTNALGLAALVILVMNPRSLFDIGFQMSFVTVFGLIYYLAPLEAMIGHRSVLLRWGVGLVGATVTAQIWLVPITAATFQRFFPIGLVSNIVVVPISWFGLTAGLALVAGGPVLAPLVRFYIDMLLGTVRFFAAHGGSSLWVAPPPASFTIGFYLACLTVVGVRRSIFCRAGFGVGLILIGAGALMRGVQRQEPARLRVTWIDTGKRLTTVIETGNGDRLLINPGPLDPVDTTERVLMPFLTGAGIRGLDAVMVTDPDRARTAGVDSLSKWVDVSTVVYRNAPAVWVTDGETTILIADRLTTKIQRVLLAMPIGKVNVVQSHFPRNWIWLPEFLDRFKPELTIETYAVSDFRPSVPPWEDVPGVAPQKLGWYRWER